MKRFPAICSPLGASVGAALTAALLLASPALAASLPEIQAMLDRGDWQTAAAAGAALNTSDGLTLAAQATTLGASVSPEDGRRALFARAQGYAQQAIKLNPGSSAAYLELARAEGRLAQTVGILQSLQLAGSIKTSLDKATTLDPRNASAFTALCVWNAELVGRGFVATTATGASAGRIAPNCERAISLEPNNPTRYYEYANALLAQSRSNRAAAIDQLQQALALPAQTYWETQDLNSARAKLASLR